MKSDKELIFEAYIKSLQKTQKNNDITLNSKPLKKQIICFRFQCKKKQMQPPLSTKQTVQHTTQSQE